MTGKKSFREDIAGSSIYRICVEGKLDEGWSGWFDGLIVELESESPPVTSLTGSVTDQACLRGILNRLWNLNLCLISVERLEESCFPSTQMSRKCE
jgi:hypothetical protein